MYFTLEIIRISLVFGIDANMYVCVGRWLWESVCLWDMQGRVNTRTKLKAVVVVGVDTVLLTQ